MEQDQKDELFLCEMLAITEVESVMTDEDEAFELLLCLCAADHEQMIFQANLRDLLQKEELEREDFIHQQFMLRNKLEVRSELIHHGFVREAAAESEFVPHAEVTDKVWESKITGNVLEHAEVKRESYSEMVNELENEDQESFSFLVGLRRSALIRKEEYERMALERESQRIVERYHLNFTRGIEYLGQMELELVEEAEAWIMLDMTADQKLIYKTSSATEGESRARWLWMFQEEEDFLSIGFRYQEFLDYGKLMERFLQGKEEIIRQKRLRTYGLIYHRTVKRHLTLRFLPWKVHSHRWAKIRRCTLVVSLWAMQCERSLLRRYCARWNQNPENRKAIDQQAEFLTRYQEQYLLLMVSEEEERDRNKLSMEWRWEAAQIAELFFQERDSLRRSCLSRDIVGLQATNIRRHRMKRLVTWYSYWKEHDLQRKCRWLLYHNEGHFVEAGFMKWKSWYEKRVYTRRERARLNAVAAPEKEQLLCECSEELGRGLIQLDEGLEQEKCSIASSQHLILTRNRWRERILASMAGETEAVQRSFRFHTWRLFISWKKKDVKARMLMYRNNNILRRRYYEKLSNYFYERMGQYSTVLLEHRWGAQILQLEHMEGFGRLVLLQSEAYFRSRKDFRSTTVFGEKGHRSLLQTFSMFAEKVNSTLLEIRWYQWIKYLKYRKHIKHCRLLAEHLDDEQEHRMMRRRFKNWLAFNKDVKKERVAIQRRDALQVELEKVFQVEQDHRDATLEEEQWAFTRVLLSHSRSIVTLRRGQQRILCEIMAGLSDKFVIQHRVSVWMKFREKRKFIEAQKPKVIAMEKAACLKIQRISYKYFVKFWWHSIRPKLAASMRKRLQTQLLRRYFKKFSPAKVRNARLSRARTQLERAQAAARLMDTNSSVEIVKTRNPFYLPPLRIAAGKPNPKLKSP